MCISHALAQHDERWQAHRFGHPSLPNYSGSKDLVVYKGEPIVPSQSLSFQDCMYRTSMEVLLAVRPIPASGRLAAQLALHSPSQPSISFHLPRSSSADIAG
jgi:hypothetical protein